jgi:hypothetical protein
MSPAEVKVGELLAELAAVLASPDARRAMDACRNEKGRLQAQQTLDAAGRWIEDAEREIAGAAGDDQRITRLLREVERVSVFVFYQGEDHVTLDGVGAGIRAWGIIKADSERSAPWRQDWWKPGPRWPLWTVPAKPVK